MSAYIQERLAALFDELTDRDMKYSKLEFPKTFEAFYGRYKDVFMKIEEMAENTDDKEAFIEEIAAYIPDHVETKIDRKQSKHRLETIFVDYNMKLVIFILPMFNYENTEIGKKISDKLVAVWNERFHMNIGNSGYEQITSGFKERLCYITTAVCQSLGKSDDCYELEILRKYRDQYLVEEGHGKEIVREYYNIAPTIVKRINQSEDSATVYDAIWSDYLLPCIRLIEANEKEKCKELYTDMVYELQKKYLYS